MLLRRIFRQALHLRSIPQRESEHEPDRGRSRQAKEVGKLSIKTSGKAPPAKTVNRQVWKRREDEERPKDDV